MIYYVEDGKNIRDLATYALSQAGFEVVGFSCAEDFENACSSQMPDLVLLDIMLPGKDGLEILESMRLNPSTRHIPVMMLTAKGSEIDKVQGLDLGADDYLAKPFGMMELVSRVNALLRRAARPAQGASGSPAEELGWLSCGAISLSPEARTATAAGVELPLTRKEFDLLRILLEHKGRVLTREQLLERVWGVSFVGETRTVDMHVKTLRKKLAAAAPGAEGAIGTVRGVGYRMREIAL